MVTGLAVMTLVNGILNILYSLGFTFAIVVGTIGVGLLCVPITILPTVLGIFEILYAVKLISNPPQPVRPSQTLAILEIFCFVTGNMVSTVVGILALVFYNDQSCQDVFFPAQ